jgi:predicted cupin superfamily sugar epimerase
MDKSHMNADRIIENLKLVPLENEGGFFYELYRSAEAAADGRHVCGTSIYYLLRETDVSRWHKLASDEIWYYHAGIPALQRILYPDGKLEEVVIGPDVMNGEVPQHLIPAGCWQTAVLTDCSENDWGLFGAAVFPGYDPDDVEFANDSEMEVLLCRN